MKRPINSRSKGKVGELEFARAIEERTGWTLTRNLEQARGGGFDLVAAPDCPLSAFAIEVKRHSKATPGLVAEWWQQTLTQAVKADKHPLLAYRADRQGWRIRIPVSVLAARQHSAGEAELSLDDFAAWIVPATDG